jgi:hypothetical protein
MPFDRLKRRQFITLLGGVAARGACLEGPKCASVTLQRD